MSRSIFAAVLVGALNACGSVGPFPMPPKRPLPAQLCNSSNRVVALHTVPATYPQLEREQRVQGWAVIRFDTAQDGRVINAAVVDSAPVDALGKDAFGEAALASVEQWRYPRGARKNMCHRIEFKLSPKTD